MRRIVGVLMLVCVAFGASAIWVWTQPDVEFAGSSGSRPDSFVARLAPGQDACAEVTIDRGPANRLQLTVGSYGRRVALDVLVDGRPAGRVRQGRQGQIGIPLRRVVEDGSSTVCVRNRARTAVVVAGEGSAVPVGADDDDRVYSVSFVLERSTPARWADTLAGSISQSGDSAGAATTGWVAVVLALLAIVVAVSGMVWATFARDPSGPERDA